METGSLEYCKLFQHKKLLQVTAGLHVKIWWWGASELAKTSTRLFSFGVFVLILFKETLLCVDTHDAMIVDVVLCLLLNWEISVIIPFFFSKKAVVYTSNVHPMRE